MYGRLLGIGLPLTVALGTAAALVVLNVDLWAALLIGAALAPTDAALGASVMSNPAVPDKVRRALNVESGLNDGIATPIVLVAIAGVAANEGIAGVESPSRAVLSLLVGVLAGAVVGGLGGAATRLARARGWLSEELAGPAVLAPGAARLHRRVAGRWQRIRCRFRRRPGLRRGRGARRREGGLLRGAVRRRRVDDQLAGLRRPGRAGDRRLVDSEDSGVRRPQPHRGSRMLPRGAGPLDGRGPRPVRVSRLSAGSGPAASHR